MAHACWAGGRAAHLSALSLGIISHIQSDSFRWLAAGASGEGGDTHPNPPAVCALAGPVTNVRDFVQWYHKPRG